MTQDARVKVAAIQLTSTDDVERNLSICERLTHEAAAAGARLVALPEAFAYLGPGDGKLAVAEPLPGGGPILARCAALARAAGVELNLGGFWEQSDDPRKVYITNVQLDASGALRASYRKIHLFDVDLPDGTSLRESDTARPGADVVVTDTCTGRLGLSVCYDMRFPELYRMLIDQGATLLSIPAAFTLTTGKDHWHVLLRARAIESQCYVIAAAQTGHHFGDRRSYGHALICDPWGFVLADAGDTEGYALASVDPARVAAIRAALPSLRHRRLWRD